MKKKWIAILGILTLTASLTGCGKDFTAPKTVRTEQTSAGEMTKEDTYILCGKDGDLSLYVNPMTTQFYVENAKDGSVWNSSPKDAENDAFADGTYRMEMLSNLIVSSENSETQASSRFNSYTGSVLDGDYTITKLDNGFRADYHFAESDSTIPFQVYLEDGALVTEVIAEEIKVGSDVIHLGDISVAPFFGAGSTADEGYLFVADGSGGVIRFNNGKNNVSAYERPIYGEEKTVSHDRYDLSLEGQNVSMPVFGVQRNGSAFVSIVENGAANAYLCANINMQQTSYANIYSRFRLYETLDYEIGSVKAPVYESGNVLASSYRNRYYFLTDSDADYNGMAKRYRSYLMEKYDLKEQDDIEAALYVELYGGVKKMVSRFGVQSTKTVALTTTEQVQEIAKELKDKGVSDLVVQYKNWNTDAMNGKSIHKGKTEKVVESRKVSLKDLLATDEFMVYPSLPKLLTFEKGGVYKKLFETAADISGVSVKNTTYAPGIGTAKKNESYYFLTANALQTELAKTRKALEKKEIPNISMSDIGNMVYNDYRDGNLRRENTQLILEKELQAFQKNQKVMLENPNAYAIPYATEIMNAPTVSGRQDLIDEDVPFYNMVVSGLIRCAAAPLNNSSVGEDGFLKALETGSMISYTWIYEDAVLVKNTDLSFLSESNYKSYMEEAGWQYQVTKEIADKAGNGTIKCHEKLADGVYRLTYETGLYVCVNYNDTEYQTADGRIAAHGWLIGEGDR